jgi:hypothetical protein
MQLIACGKCMLERACGWAVSQQFQIVTVCDWLAHEPTMLEASVIQ